MKARGIHPHVRPFREVVDGSLAYIAEIRRSRFATDVESISNAASCARAFVKDARRNGRLRSTSTLQI